MLLALGFTAIFTAGVVDRLIDRRLTTIVGKRAVPRRDHVVVVGLGQVGLRLCLLLQDLGIRVLAVEVNADNHHVNRAKEYGIPVVLGRGGSRFLLRRLCLPRARALAAVTSDEVENISIVVAALGMRAGPANAAAGRSRRGRERDPIAVQDRRGARHLPNRRNVAGGGRARLRGYRRRSCTADGAPDPAGRPDRGGGIRRRGPC